jgi:hypothetical protein
MAITINYRPETWTPVYAPIPYNLDSDNKNEIGFSYFVQVFSGTSLTDGVMISTNEIPPAPVNGLGYFDIRSIAQPYTVWTLPETNATFTSISDFFVPLYLRFGESTPRWRFTQNFVSGGFVAFLSSENHNFEVGDEIIVSQDIGYPQEIQAYEGLQTVSSISSNFIVTTQAFLGVSTGIGGFIKKADGSSITLSGLSTDTTYGFKSSFSRVEMTDYEESDWISVAVNNSSKWLTECPQNHKIGRDDEIWLTTLQNTTNDNRRLLIRTSGSSNTELGVYTIYNPFSADSKEAVAVAVGVDQINSQSDETYISFGSLPVFDENVTQYSVQTVDGSSNVLQRQNFVINDSFSCSRFGNKKLLFRDRKGSLITFNFPYKSTERKKYDRKLYKKIINGFSDSSPYFTYPTQGGQTQFTIDEKTEFDVYTDFITEEEGRFLVENLIPSPQVWEYQSALDYKPVVLKNGSFEIKQRLNGLVQYKLSYEYALDDYLFE